jgi:release factor glutamine methyltransferase
MINIKQAIIEALTLLTPVSDTPRLDAEILLQHSLACSRTYLYTHPETFLTTEQHLQFSQLIQQRLLGKPIAYITGTKEFWSLSLQVSKATLIPRSETELLVELTLKHLATIGQAHILDLGTGSGAIALALAAEKPDWHILAIDQSTAALQIACNNAQHLQLPHIHFLASNWFNAIPPQLFHAIVANPPYIAEYDVHLAQGDLRYEPQSALISGPDGLDDLRIIITTALHFLHPDGLLLVEHGFNQGQTVQKLFIQCNYRHVETIKDIQGRDRVTFGKRIG